MRKTPISTIERKRAVTVGWILDIGQGILTLTGVGEIVNEIIDIVIYIGFIVWMLIRRVITMKKILFLTLVFAAEEIPGLDLFWFWKNFAQKTMYEGAPEEGGSADMPPIIPPPIIEEGGRENTPRNGPKPPPLPRNTNLKPPPLNVNGVRIPRR